jgi:acetoin utilization deacetylase AcuC-like enzyme
LNDQAIAAQFLLNHKLAKKIVIDLDVHQGNGTAEIFQNNPKCSRFLRMVPIIHSKKKLLILDIAFDDGTTDDAFLKLLAI